MKTVFKIFSLMLKFYKKGKKHCNMYETEIFLNYQIKKNRYEKSIDVKHRIKLKFEILKSTITSANTFIEK